MQSAQKGGGEPESAGWGGHAALPEGRREPPPFTFLGNPPRHATPSFPAQPSLTEATFSRPTQPDLDTKDITRPGESWKGGHLVFFGHFSLYCPR